MTGLWTARAGLGARPSIKDGAPRHASCSIVGHLLAPRLNQVR